MYAVLVAQEQIFYDVRRWWFGLGLACRCGGYLDRCGRSFVGEAMTELHGKEFVARACTVSRMHFFWGGRLWFCLNLYTPERWLSPRFGYT